MRLNIVIAALVALGCGSTHGDGGASPRIDGSIEQSPQDSGMSVDESPPPPLDGGGPPSADSGVEQPDAGHAPIDAEVGDDAGEDAGEDAGDTDEDASVGMCSGDLTAPATFGTAEEPVVLAAAEVTFEGEIDWRGRAFARITGVTPGARYAITATATSQIVLAAFTDDASFRDAACVSGDQVTEREPLCLVTATGASLDVTVDARDMAATFALTVAPVYPPEGMWLAPVQLEVSELPYDLGINSEARSFYEITGLTPAVPYVVSVRGASTGVRLEVYEGGTFLGSATDQQAGPRPTAIGTPLGTSLLVALQAGHAGTTAQLDVRPATRAPEGTAEAPVPIAASALPYEGEVGWSYNPEPPPVPRPPPHIGGSDSFYTITGLTPGTYVVSVEDASAPVYVLLDEPDISSSAHLPPSVRADEGVPARITTRVTGSTLAVTLKNQGGDSTAFTLDVEPSSLASVGAEGAPVEIPLAALPYTGEVEPNLYSYYELTGLTPGQKYMARISDVNEAAVGVLFVDEATNQACEVQAQTGSSGACAVTPLRTSARFQARVFGYTHAIRTGSVFTLSLDPVLEEQVGTREEPVVLECSSGTYQGRIGTTGESLFEITDLEPGAAYLVEASLGDNDLSMYVFTGASGQPFFEPSFCVGYGFRDFYPARCISTPVAESLFVQVNSYSSSEALEITWRRAATGSEGTPSAPVALELSDFPYAGTVSGVAPSFYTISNLQPGTAYVARIVPIEEQLEMRIYSGDGLEGTQELGAAPVFPGAPFEGVFTVSETTGTLKIELPIGADGVGSFELDVSPQD